MNQPTLHLRDLRHAGQADGRFELARSPIRIGRGPRCEIRLHSEEIADVQVILRRDGNRWLIHPVGPADGCLFNGEPLAETQGLSLGTRFTIGHVELTMGDPLAQPHARPAEAPAATAPRPMIHELSSTSVAPPAPHRPEPVLPPAALIMPEPPVVPEPVRPVPARPTVTAAEPVSRHPAALAPTPGLEFEQTGLLADLARRAVEKGQRRQQKPANPVVPRPAGAFAAVDLSQPLGELTIGRAMPAMGIKRPGGSSGGVAAAASLSDWADEFARRYRNGQLPARSVETPPPADPGVAYQPKPLPRFQKMSHSADAGAIFLDQMPAVAPKPARKPSEPAPADFPSLVTQLRPSERVETQEHCFHEPAVAFHEVQWTTDYETHVDLEPELYFQDPTVDAGLIEETPEVGEAAEVNEIFAELDDEPWTAAVATVPVQLSESLTPEKFEQWISSVGPILGDLEQSSGEIEPIEPAGGFDYGFIDDDSAIDDDEAYGLEAEYDAEIDAETASAEADIMMADLPLGEVEDEAEPVVVETLATAVHDAELESEDEIGVEEESEDEPEVESAVISAGLAAAEAEPAVDKADEEDQPENDGQWPSVQDIMRWSAVREGDAYEDGPKAAQTRDDHEIAPHQVMRVNLPVAGVICLAWLGLSAVLVQASMRMGLQDELTQKTITAINTATANNSTPRLPAAQISKLTSVPSWWSITGEQIWWRATFLKMREQNGQAAAEASATLAEKAVAANPLLPQGRVWNLARQAGGSNGGNWAGLSRDVTSLLITADHYRRIGDDEQANAADRQALELATAPDRVLIEHKVMFDAELGTGRFLLPNQQDVVEILKRLVKEPNAAELIGKIMPEDRPLVWLTAAQFLKQTGLGDPERELARIVQRPTPARATLDQQRVEQAIRAEALAMQGKTVEAAEIYMQLTQASPDSVWKRAWFFNHGDLSHRNQKTEAALVSWRKARGDDPNHEVDRHAIQASRSLTSSAGAADTSRNTIRTN